MKSIFRALSCKTKIPAAAQEFIRRAIEDENAQSMHGLLPELICTNELMNAVCRRQVRMSFLQKMARFSLVWIRGRANDSSIRRTNQIMAAAVTPVANVMRKMQNPVHSEKTSKYGENQRTDPQPRRECYSTFGWKTRLDNARPCNAPLNKMLYEKVRCLLRKTSANPSVRKLKNAKSNLIYQS